MAHRFLPSTRTAVALVVALSMTSAQSQSQQVRPPQRCEPPGINPATGMARQSTMKPCPSGTVCKSECPIEGPCTAYCVKQQTESQTYDGESTVTDQSTEGESNDGQRPAETGGGGGGGKGLGTLLAVLGGAVITGLAIKELNQQTASNWVSPEQLDADGPHFPTKQKLGRFQVQAYAQAGWPLVVDINTMPGTWTWLEVRYQGSDRKEVVDMTRPEGGRRTEVVSLPGTAGSVDIARYSIRSALLPRGREPLYRPIEVYGIGAGPNAVGSPDETVAEFGIRPTQARTLFKRAAAARQSPLLFNLAAANGQNAALYLSVTNFGPPAASSPATVNWTVSARRTFPLSRIEVLRFPKNDDGKLTPVGRADIDLLARREARGNWGALSTTAKVGKGKYALQARAWRTRAGGGDWTGAFAPNYVFIQ
jgi:hypothetical protein